MVNSRSKGARGERQWRDEIREAGWNAERGQQRSGSPDSPDVKHDMPFPFHFEVKRVERLNLFKAFAQAEDDCSSEQIPVVVTKRNGKKWVACMYADDWFSLVRDAK